MCKCVALYYLAELLAGRVAPLSDLSLRADSDYNWDGKSLVLGDTKSNRPVESIPIRLEESTSISQVTA